MSSSAVAFDLGRCLTEIHVAAEERKRIKAALLLTVDGLIAEMAGPAYVGQDRIKEIAWELRGLREEIETL